MTYKKIFLISLKAVFTFFLFYLIFKKIDKDSLIITLVNIDYYLFLLSIFFIFLQILGISFRLFLIIKKNFIKISLYKTIKMTFEGAFLNQALPMSIGGDAIKIWRIKNTGVDLFNSFLVILFDRLVGLFALLLLSIFSLLFFFEQINISINLLTTVLTISLILIYLSYYFLYKKKKNKKIYNGFVFFISNFNLRILVISLITHLISFTGIYLICLALDIKTSFFAILSTMPLVFLATLFPLSIGGWGVREISMVFLLSFIGIEHELAFALSILFGFTLILTGLPGGIILFLRRFN